MSHSPSADNAFAGNPLDRASHLRNRADWLAERLKAPESLIVPVWRTRPFVTGGRRPEIGWLRPGVIDDLAAGGETVFLGMHGDIAHFALEIPAEVMLIASPRAFSVAITPARSGPGKPGRVTMVIAASETRPKGAKAVGTS